MVISKFSGNILKYIQETAYIFHLNDSVWNQQAILRASDGQSGDLFGWDVSIFEDFAIVGAYEACNFPSNYYY